MKRANHLYRSVAILLSLLLLFTAAEAQKKKVKIKGSAAQDLLWTPVDVSQQDLYLGPGGTAMLPDIFEEVSHQGRRRQYVGRQGRE